MNSRRLLIILALALLFLLVLALWPQPPEPIIRERLFPLLASQRVRLDVAGPERHLSPTPWYARLSDTSGRPIAGAKLVFSFAYEGNREVAATTGSDGWAAANLPFGNDPLSACCVDGDTNPTFYIVSVRFEGNETYQPEQVDAYLGYRSSSGPLLLTIEETPPVVPAGGIPVLTARLTANGSPVAGERLLWHSIELGQHPQCVTDSNGRCAVSFDTAGRAPGSYAVSATPKTNVPATDAVAIHITGNNTPPVTKRVGGWFWWQYTPENPQAASHSELGLYYKVEVRDIVSGWDSANNHPRLNTTALDRLVKDAASRDYSYPWGSGPQQVIIGYQLDTELRGSANTTNPLGSPAYAALGCGAVMPPVWDAGYRARVARGPYALRAWYDANPDAQAAVVGIQIGAGFDGEFLNPLSNDCMSAYNALGVGALNVHMSSLERLMEQALSDAFAGTGLLLSSESIAAGGAARWPPINAKFGLYPRPLLNSYRSSSPELWGWLAKGRVEWANIACERADSAFLSGGATGSLDFPGHWGPTWGSLAQGAHMRCAFLASDRGSGILDGLEVGGKASIPGLSTLAQSVITSDPCENRTAAAWWAHEVQFGHTKEDLNPFTRNAGYASGAYGDFDACLVRRDVSPAPVILTRSQLPQPAQTSFYAYGYPRPRTIAWDGNTPVGADLRVMARRGNSYHYDLHDGFAIGKALVVEVVALGDGGTVAISWPTKAGIETAKLSLPRSNDWERLTFNLTDYDPTQHPFPSMTDLRIEGSGLTLAHVLVRPSGQAIPPTRQPLPTPTRTPTAPPTSTRTPTRIPPTATPLPPTATRPPATATPGLEATIAALEGRIRQLEERQGVVERLLRELAGVFEGLGP